jgi:hypothetical protein
MTKWLGTPGIMGQDNKKKNYQKPSHYSNILIEIATILTTSQNQHNTKHSISMPYKIFKIFTPYL